MKWEIIGPPEIRGDAPVQMFQPTPSRTGSTIRTEAGVDIKPAIDATERFLLRVFLRRYVTLVRVAPAFRCDAGRRAVVRGLLVRSRRVDLFEQLVTVL